MQLLSLLKKFCIGGIWHVGLRDYTASKKMTYKDLKMPEGEWIADPFLFEDRGRHFLFCEHYFEKENKAGISCFEIINGNIGTCHLILKKPYHLSYPCVFKAGERYFMIPESSANDTVDLYEATEFPFKWEHKKTLLRDGKYVDSTVYYDGKSHYLLTYQKNNDGWNLIIFLLNTETLSLSKLSERTYTNNIGRPAGFLFTESNKLIRPAQNCLKKYGENILLYQIDEFNTDSFKEHIIGEITVNDITYPQNVDRIHTINRDSKYEVIDVFAEKLDFKHGFKILKRAYLK